ncbi:helix-turn-helix domain-containing protein [Serratia fonticola]
MSTWVNRRFPGEAIVKCALEMGVSLYWLATVVEENKLISFFQGDSYLF